MRIKGIENAFDSARTIGYHKISCAVGYVKRISWYSPQYLGAYDMNEAMSYQNLPKFYQLNIVVHKVQIIVHNIFLTYSFHLRNTCCYKSFQKGMENSIFVQGGLV